jgi:hypothetical protein
MLVQPVAATKVLAVKAGTSIDPACLPCQPACLVLCPLLALTPVKLIFLNLEALSNLFFIDIYGSNEVSI